MGAFTFLFCRPAANESWKWSEEEVPPENDELSPQLGPAGVKPRPAFLLDWLEVTPPLWTEGLVTWGVAADLVPLPLVLLGMPWPRPEVCLFPLLLGWEFCPLPVEFEPPDQVSVANTCRRIWKSTSALKRANCMTVRRTSKCMNLFGQNSITKNDLSRDFPALVQQIQT